MEYRLIAFIEKEVENAHVGLETKLLPIDLIILVGSEFCVMEWLLGTDCITEIL